MYKSISKRIQRMRENASPLILNRETTVRRQKTIDNNNERRCPFFSILYQAAKRHRSYPHSFPEWLKKEIDFCGGVEKWVHKNFYWQKWYRQYLYKTFVRAHECGSSMKEPKWFRKEIKKIGLPGWLKIFSERQENHIIKREGVKTIIVRNGNKVTYGLDEKTTSIGLSELDSKSIQKNPTGIVKSNLTNQKLQKKKVKRKNKRRKKKSDDALFHAVSGGGFETNRSRH